MPFLNRLSGLTFSDFERNLESEPALIAEITEKMRLVQANAAARQKRAVARGTHAKGVCARAKFEVFDVSVGRGPALGERLAKGIYAKPEIYPAIVRFANGDPNVNSDFKADLRALSFSVELVPSGGAAAGANVSRQDYSMQNATTFIVNDARAFIAFAKVLSASSPAKGSLSLPWQEKLLFVRTLAIALRQAHQPVKPYQQLRYWSQVPFRHGPTDVVKYSATPSANNPARAVQKKNPDALQDELLRHLKEDTKMSSFDFALQFLNTERMTYWGKRRDADFWIENASVEWPETQAPFHTVARLSLLPKSQLPSDESESVYFDVTGNSLPDSTPLGSINRTRWPAEVASRQARMSRLSA
jgi:catalase